MTDPVAFAMPSLGADMDEGRVTEWLVQPGDHVERGQIVVIVETDKSDIEVEIFQPATITELLVAEGDLVPVGTPIALLRPDHDTVPSRPTAATTARAVSVPSETVTHEAASSETARVTSPVLRHLADELHVDASHVHGTGPGGRVVRDDIVRAAGAPDRTAPRTPVATRAQRGRNVTPRARRLMSEHGLEIDRFADRALVTGDDVLAVLASTSDPVDTVDRALRDRAPTRQESMRRHIAELMETSWREIPHYHVGQRFDLSVALARLATTNELRPLTDRIVPGALLLCAAARAASRVPDCNGWWRGGELVRSETVDIGLVLSLRTGGIIVPTIQQADQLSPAEMMRQMTDLVQRARQGRLRASQMAEASLTVTSLGDRGADVVTGVIHPPQVALIGFGAIRDEVWPHGGGGVDVRPTVHASLAGDHRATDGLAGSRFLAQMQALLDTALPAELDDAGFAALPDAGRTVARPDTPEVP